MSSHARSTTAATVAVGVLLFFSNTFAQTASDKSRNLNIAHSMQNAPPKLPFEQSVIIYYGAAGRSQDRNSSPSEATKAQNTSPTLKESLKTPSAEPPDSPKQLQSSASARRVPSAVIDLQPILIYYKAPAPRKIDAVSEPQTVKTQAKHAFANSESPTNPSPLKKPTAIGLERSFDIEPVALSNTANFTETSVRARPLPIAPPEKPPLSIPVVVPRPNAEPMTSIIPRPVPGVPQGPTPSEALVAGADSISVENAVEPAPLSASAAAVAADSVELNNSAVRLTAEANFNEAASLLKKAIQAKPDVANFHRNLSIVYERMNMMDAALASARTAAGLAPENPLILDQLCALELDAGNTAASIACFEKMNSIKPLDVLAQAYYGTALFRAGKIDESLSVLEKAAASTPLVAEALNAVGVVYFTKKRTEDAIAAFKSAVETDPELLEVRYNLAVAELAHRNKAAAISQYNFIKSENPRLADQLYRMLYGDKLLNASEMKTTKH